MRRTERTADTLKEEIAQIVGYELEDPRLTMVTVTDVRLSADKRAARVYVTVAGDEERAQSGARGFEARRALRAQSNLDSLESPAHA